MQGLPPTPSLGANWTPLTRNVLVGLFALYVVQLLSNGVVAAWLAWWPGATFGPWQPFTSFILPGPRPLDAIFDLILIYFTLAPLDSILGRRQLAYALGASWATAALLGILATGLGFLPHLAPAYGLTALCAALVMLLGSMMPGATFLAFFVLPVKAIWLAWGTGLLCLLNLVYYRELGAALPFFAWLGAWGYVTVRGGSFRRLSLRWKKHQIERKLAKFEVIEGGRTGGKTTSRKSGTSDDWIH